MNTYGALQHIAALTTASRSSLNRTFVGDDFDEESRYTTAIDRTPLIRHSIFRSHRSLVEDRRMRREAIFNWKVGFLFLILISGTSIGVYLLISDNIDHREDFPYYLIDLENWYDGIINKSLPQLPVENVSNLIISHTRSISCSQFNHCKNIINNKLINRNLFDIPFNFLISQSGETYEVRGWHLSSGFTNNSLISNDSIAVGFIGDFSNLELTTEQIKELHVFIRIASQRNQLRHDFKIFGARSNETDGEEMFKTLSEFTHWQGFL